MTQQANAGNCGDLSFEKPLHVLKKFWKNEFGEATLDMSLKLFEEADQLIGLCNKRLSEAERVVETLIKNRSGDLVLGADGKPTTTDFSPNR